MHKFGSFKRYFFGFILNYYEQVAISNVLESLPSEAVTFQEYRATKYVK